ncbi:hypothetical protein [Pseudomonas sp. GOM6]|uniref:DUF7688 family protein n=1 Tax=Pseudomonas sp. GOM6 TaxID=3036944 RepID=UPI00240A62BE|nr:hypothetical protein [Pseudomonas sp. GOM6]MDG1580976.1 hypothetical protein [Pseudomonas sp. GOM6]
MHVATQQMVANPCRHEIHLNGERLTGGDQKSVAVVWNNLTGKNLLTLVPKDDESQDHHLQYLKMIERLWSCSITNGSVITLCDEQTGHVLDKATIQFS